MFAREARVRRARMLGAIVLAAVLAGPGASRAQTPCTVTVGQVQQFTDCNYHDDNLFLDYEGRPLSDWKESVAQGNTAHVSVTAGPGTAARAVAEIGLVFELDYGFFDPDEVQDWPVSITADLDWDVAAEWGRGTAEAGLGIQDLQLTDLVRTGPPQEPEQIVDSGSVTCTAWPGGRPIRVSDFSEAGGCVHFGVHCLAWTRVGDPENSAAARVTVHRITIAIPEPDAQGSTTTTAPPTTTMIPENSTTTTSIQDPGTPVTTTIASGSVPDFMAQPRSGPAPLAVRFYPQLSENAGDPLWEFGDGQISTAPDPLHVYEEPGLYTAALSVRDPVGVVQRVEKPAFIEALPAALQADFKLEPVFGAPALAVQFQDCSAGDPTQWWWEFGDGQDSAERHPLHTYEAPGLYTVRLEVVDATGAVDSREKPDAVQVLDEPLTVVFAADPLQGSPPLQVSFRDESTGDAAGWLWHFGDGDYSTEQHPVHTYGLPGRYSVGLRISDGKRTVTALEEDLIEVLPGAAGGFSLAGAIRDAGETPVEVFLSGEQDRHALFDNGTYLFGDLAAGRYLVTPRAPGRAFDPPGRETVIMAADVTGIDFTTLPRSGVVIESVQAAPETVPADGSTELLLLVQAAPVDGVEPPAAVLVDCEPIGGSYRQKFYDDGTHGDEVPGDTVYSFLTQVADGTAPGPKGLVVRATDSTGAAAFAQIPVQVRVTCADTIDRGATQRTTIVNEVQGQTLVTGYALEPDVTGSSIRGAGTAESGVLLQVFTPEGEPYFDSEISFGEQAAEVQVPDAARGVWTFQVRNIGTASRSYNVSVSTAGTGVVTGVVFDAETGQGVDGVSVMSSSGAVTMTIEGYYVLVHPAGVYSIEACPTGTYASSAHSVTVDSGTSQEINFALCGTGQDAGGGDACVFESLQERFPDKATPALLRRLRDIVLRRSAVGRRWTALYYRFGPELREPLARQPALAVQASGCLHVLLPAVRAAAESGVLVLSPAQLDAATALLGCLQAQAGPVLQRELGMLVHRLRVYGEAGSGLLY